ncbi:MAG: hypothetical protein K2X27_11360, partial [Candidatus Obscuribacterales bacterium]|nr:hypothetical protein [Candidatus Obscuribacterales bacterium]
QEALINASCLCNRAFPPIDTQDDICSGAYILCTKKFEFTPIRLTSLRIKWQIVISLKFRLSSEGALK